MSISFNNIPAGGGIKVPLFYAEMNNSQANYGVSTNLQTLLIGQMLASGSAVANVPVLVSSVSNAIALFGRGSMLARMMAIYRQTDPLGSVWAIPVPDNGSGVQATGTITVAGPATAAGTINLYIAGQLVQVAVSSTDTANTVAASINAAINAASDLPVTSTVSSAVVTMTCRWKGATGNDIMVSDSFLGAAGGQTLPTGITLTYAAMASGATNPLLSTAITAMGNTPFDYIIHPYTDSTSQAAMTLQMNDTVGRWSYVQQVYGHVYTALRGTLSALVTAGNLLNDPHLTMAAIDVDCPHPSWEYAAAYGAANAIGIKQDPARPTQTLPLNGLLAPRQGKRFLFSDMNSLLSNGVATSSVVVGQLQVQRAITTYQKDAYGNADSSYLDSETLHLSAYILRYLASWITSKYPRHKVAADGTRYGSGNAIVTPAVIRGDLIAAYNQLMNLGLVQNAAAFAANLLVQINGTNPNRIDVLLPPEYVGQLRIFALLNQFRLTDPPVPVSS